jgi:hypothetical protein
LRDTPVSLNCRFGHSQVLNLGFVSER